jgi:hypothetical protein
MSPSMCGRFLNSLGKVKDPEKFRERCVLHPPFDKMRRWVAFPEETKEDG